MHTKVPHLCVKINKMLTIIHKASHQIRSRHTSVLSTHTGNILSMKKSTNGNQSNNLRRKAVIQKSKLGVTNTTIDQSSQGSPKLDDVGVVKKNTEGPNDVPGVVSDAQKLLLGGSSIVSSAELIKMGVVDTGPKTLLNQLEDFATQTTYIKDPIVHTDGPRRNIQPKSSVSRSKAPNSRRAKEVTAVSATAPSAEKREKRAGGNNTNAMDIDSQVSAQYAIISKDCSVSKRLEEMSQNTFSPTLPFLDRHEPSRTIFIDSLENRSSVDAKERLLKSITPHATSFVCGQDVHPKQTQQPCLHCLSTFTHVPVGTASSFDDKRMVFSGVWGWWCTAGCRNTWFSERNMPNAGQRQLVHAALDSNVLGLTMVQSSARAPPSRFHQNFGGPCPPDVFMKIALGGESQPVVRMIDQSLLIPTPILFEVTAPTSEHKQMISSFSYPCDERIDRGNRVSNPVLTHMDPIIAASRVEIDEDGQESATPVIARQSRYDGRSLGHRMDDTNQMYSIGPEEPRRKFKVGGNLYDEIYANDP